jgi:beta-glucosidase
VPEAHVHAPLTLDSPLRDFERSFLGRILYASVMGMASRGYKEALKMPESLERDMKLKNSYFLVRLLPSNSIRSMCMSSGGQFTYQQAIGFVELANGRIWRGLKAFLRKEKPLPLPSQTQGGVTHDV